MEKSRLSWKEQLIYTDRVGDDRSRMRAAANNVLVHIHPTTVQASALRLSYTWGLGGISVVLAGMLAITGVLLMFRYDATVDQAYMSIQVLETQVIFGSLIRAVHHWSANLLVITTGLHLLRVFLTGSYKRGRTANWVVGVVLLMLVLAFNFTGYLLPWDQLAFWAITVSTSLLDYIPLVGGALSSLILGGPEVGQNALRNFYAVHVVVLPVILILTMVYHFWKIRKSGGLTQPDRPSEEKVRRVTTIPHLIEREIAAAAVVFVGVTIFAMFLPAPLGEIANPALSPNPAKAAWYFLGLQELLLHMDALAAIVLVAVLLGALVLLPGLDRDEGQVGIYFRSRTGRLSALTGGLLGVNLIPLLIFVDEYFVDLPQAMPMLPGWVVSGLLPLALTLGGICLVYLGIRRSLKASHSESVVGLFTFLVASILMLTVIGIYFRGPNMHLVLPF
jgi:quinol-cytochrome oxidoreductase complex cytochrome b subunit